jgi:hypothetical protein
VEYARNNVVRKIVPKGWVWLMLFHLHLDLEEFEDILKRNEIIEF